MAHCFGWRTTLARSRSSVNCINLSCAGDHGAELNPSNPKRVTVNGSSERQCGWSRSVQRALLRVGSLLPQSRLQPGVILTGSGTRALWYTTALVGTRRVARYKIFSGSTVIRLSSQCYPFPGEGPSRAYSISQGVRKPSIGKQI